MGTRYCSGTPVFLRGAAGEDAMGSALDPIDAAADCELIQQDQAESPVAVCDAQCRLQLHLRTTSLAGRRHATQGGSPGCRPGPPGAAATGRASALSR